MGAPWVGAPGLREAGGPGASEPRPGGRWSWWASPLHSRPAPFAGTLYPWLFLRRDPLPLAGIPSPWPGSPTLGRDPLPLAGIPYPRAGSSTLARDLLPLGGIPYPWPGCPTLGRDALPFAGIPYPSPGSPTLGRDLLPLGGQNVEFFVDPMNQFYIFPGKRGKSRTESGRWGFRSTFCPDSGANQERNVARGVPFYIFPARWCPPAGGVSAAATPTARRRSPGLTNGGESAPPTHTTSSARSSVPAVSPLNRRGRVWVRETRRWRVITAPMGVAKA